MMGTVPPRQAGLWSRAGQGAALWKGQMREAAPHRLSAGLLVRPGGRGRGTDFPHPAASLNERVGRPCSAEPALSTEVSDPSPQACGVDYEVKAFCAENLEEKIHKR